MGATLDVVLGVAAVGVAALAHEAVHAAVAVALGGEARIRWRATETHYRFPDHRDAPWRHYAVLLAPAATGVAGGVAWVAAVGVPPAQPMTLLWGFAWAVFALGGGLDDVRVQPVAGAAHRSDRGHAAGGDGGGRSHTRGGWRPPGHWLLLAASVGCVLAGWALFRLAAGVTPAGLADVVGAVAAGLVLGGTAALGLSVVEYADDPWGARDSTRPSSGD